MPLNIILYVALALGSFGFGFLSSTKYHEAAQYKALQKAVNDITDNAQDNINTLHNDWTVQVEERNQLLIDASLLRDEDAKRESVVIKRLEGMNSELRKIGSRIAIVDNVGVCRLDDEFIRVWNEISVAAKAGRAKG